MILINLLLMHIVGIESLIKMIILWFTFVLINVILNMLLKKLYARTIGSYLILRRFGSNAYLIDLPSYVSISPIFNVKDLFSYRASNFAFFCFCRHVFHSGSSCSFHCFRTTDEVLNVFDYEFVTSHSDGYRHFFIQWKDRPSTYDAWITGEEFCRFDHGLLESNFHFTTLETSSFQSERNNGDHN